MAISQQQVGSSTPVYIAADGNDRKTIKNLGAASVYYDTTNAVSASSTELTSGSSLDITQGRWFIAAAPGAGLTVKDQGDSIVADDLEVADTLTVTGASTHTGTTTLTGAVTNTGGISGAGAISSTGLVTAGKTSGTSLTVTTNATVGGTLAVTGTTTAAAINASGTVAAAGAVTVGTTLAVTGVTTQTGNLSLAASGTRVDFAHADQAQTTVGIAGGGTALPATPTGYVKVKVAGADALIPYYPVPA